MIFDLTEIFARRSRDKRGPIVIEKKAILIEDEKRGDSSMIDIGAIGILALILTLGSLEAVTVVNQHPDDEYIVEHEVLRKDALAEAKKLEIYPGKDHHFSPTNFQQAKFAQNFTQNTILFCLRKSNAVLH